MAGIRLGEYAARDVLLVRAIESEDTAATVLTRDDRQYATSIALTSTRLGETADRRRTAEFLAQRARLAFERLLGRYPALQHAGNLTRWPQFLNWALPLSALVFGLATNAVEGDQLNILAFPLLGMLAWNLAIYVWLIFNWVRRLYGGVKRGGAPAVINWMLRSASAQLAGHPTLERSVLRFARDWAAVATPLTRSRLTRTLHLSAATFALGIVAGMFARARYTAEYTAGWAGTWAGAEAEIAALLKVVLGPASGLTGISLPTVERLRELRGTGENAGDWLILWMVTATVFVIVPRLLLALGSLVRTAHLERGLEIPHDFYVRRVLRDAIGRARTVRIVPYSFDLSAEARTKLDRLLRDALGEKTTIETESSIAYGKEDEWVEAQAGKLAGADLLVVLFNLASTPEAENHGELVDGLRKQLNGQAAELMVLVDDSSFMRKLRGQASAPRRVDERLLTWRTVLAPCEIDPIRVSLDSTDEIGAARALEQAFLHNTSVK